MPKTAPNMRALTQNHVVSNTCVRRGCLGKPGSFIQLKRMLPRAVAMQRVTRLRRTKGPSAECNCATMIAIGMVKSPWNLTGARKIKRPIAEGIKVRANCDHVIEVCVEA